MPPKAPPTPPPLPASDFRVPGWPADRPAYESLAAAVQGEGSRWNVPGVAVAILQDGQVQTASAGFANLATRAPMTDDTISQVGSISKVFTATLAMLLVDDGLLDLDTPVRDYLPDLRLSDPDAQAAVTLRHLLTHTSGIEGDRFIDYGRGDDALARAVAEFHTLRQWFRPGDLWSYSNAGYYLACRVIEVVAGVPFETVFRERLLQPLGLDAHFFAEDVITRPHAVGHYLKRREEGHTMAHGYAFPRHVNGTGGVVTSARELLRFARFHMDGGKVDGKRLLKARSAKQMQSPVVEAGDFHRHYAVGWCVHDFPEFRTLSHGGATRGFRANLTVLPDRGFAIAILTNGEAGSRAIQEIEAWALHHLLGLARPVPPRTTLQPQALASFAGTRERHDGHYTVTVVDDRLDMRVVSIHEETGEVEDDQVYPLVPVADTRFRVPDGPNKGASIDFITWQGGGVTREFLRMGGRLAERSSGQAGKGAADEKKRVKGKAKRKGKKQ